MSSLPLNFNRKLESTFEMSVFYRSYHIEIIIESLFSVRNCENSIIKNFIHR